MDFFESTASDAGPLLGEYFELEEAAGPAQYPDWAVLLPFSTRTDLQTAPNAFGEELESFADVQGISDAFQPQIARCRPVFKGNSWPRLSPFT